MTCYRHKKWSSIIRSWPSRDRRSLFAPFVERFDGNWDLTKTDQLFGSIWAQFVEHFSNPGKGILHQLSPFQENMHIFNTPRKFSHVFNNYFYLLSTSTTKSTEIVSHLFHVSRHVTKLTSLLILIISGPLYWNQHREWILPLRAKRSYSVHSQLRGSLHMELCISSPSMWKKNPRAAK